MDELSFKEKMPQEILTICAMNAVLHTEGVAEMAPLPGMTSLGKEKERERGVRVSETKKGLQVDVYLNVAFGTKIPDTAWKIQENVKRRMEDLTEEKIFQVNIHIMGVSAEPRMKGNE